MWVYTVALRAIMCTSATPSGIKGVTICMYLQVHTYISSSVFSPTGWAEVHNMARNATFHNLCCKSHVIGGEPIAIYRGVSQLPNTGRNSRHRATTEKFSKTRKSPVILYPTRESNPNPLPGPFKTSIASITDCAKPAKPYMKNPPVVFQSTTNNSTLSGNITFFRDTKNMKIRVKSFIPRDGKWEQLYLINNLDCHGMVLHLICVTMNIKYDRKNCLYYKGSFKTSIVNIRDCPNPGKQFVKNPSMVYDTLIIKDDGKNMIGGNLTVYKDTRDIKMKLKSYEWLDGKWHQIHVINSVDCHGMLMYLTFAAMKVNYDKKNCMVLKIL
ncbi:hypothetical protein SFRURICE_021104 [Spodoptera frugiperda]|nr:hypothetical protein SFRURICE_021104 [Spodoptera frugiperda]